MSARDDFSTSARSPSVVDTDALATPKRGGVDCLDPEGATLGDLMLSHFCRSLVEPGHESEAVIAGALDVAFHDFEAIGKMLRIDDPGGVDEHQLGEFVRDAMERVLFAREIGRRFAARAKAVAGNGAASHSMSGAQSIEGRADG